MKKAQDQDCKRVVATIMAEQNVTEAEMAAHIMAESAKKKAGKAYREMVKGKNVKGLRELDTIMEDLKDLYEDFNGFEIVRSYITDRIEDEEMVLKKAQK